MNFIKIYNQLKYKRESFGLTTKLPMKDIYALVCRAPSRKPFIVSIGNKEQVVRELEYRQEFEPIFYENTKYYAVATMNEKELYEYLDNMFIV